MSDWHRMFRRVRTGETSASLQDIFPQCSKEEQQFSAAFFADYGTGRGTRLLTPFCGIVQEAGPLLYGEALVRGNAQADAESRADGVSALEMCLGRELEASLPERRVAVAVSGGVDSWLLAALLKQRGYEVCGWYLETGVPGYCEREQVEHSSRALGIPYRSVCAGVRDFVDALPEFVAAVQWPVYNLHPVSKWLLGKMLQQEGITTVVTGDAADQVMRWDWDCDLLPLTISSFHDRRVRMVAPFLSDEVIRCCRKPYTDKQPVRELAGRLCVPATKKQPTLFPAVPLPKWPRAPLPDCADTAFVPPERKALLAYTTGLLLEALGGR